MAHFKMLHENMPNTLYLRHMKIIMNRFEVAMLTQIHIKTFTVLLYLYTIIDTHTHKQREREKQRVKPKAKYKHAGFLCICIKQRRHWLVMVMDATVSSFFVSSNFQSTFTLIPSHLLH